MAITPDKPKDDTTYKAHFVPLEERESQNVKPAPFIKNYILIIGVTILGGIAGALTGRAMEPRNIKLSKLAAMKFGSDKVDRMSGMVAGAEVGGIWGLFHHWKKAEGKQIGIKNLSTELRDAIDPAQIEKEAKKEEAILSDLKILEERLKTQPQAASHAQSVTARREESSRENSIA